MADSRRCRSLDADVQCQGLPCGLEVSGSEQIYMYIYKYIQRERYMNVHIYVEREIYIHIDIYIDIYIASDRYIDRYIDM